MDGKWIWAERGAKDDRKVWAHTAGRMGLGSLQWLNRNKRQSLPAQRSVAVGQPRIKIFNLYFLIVKQFLPTLLELKPQLLDAS